MSLNRRINEIAVGNFLFPATSTLMNRRNILSNYRKFRKSERLPQEKLVDIQETHLRELIQYAYNRIPFYRKRFDNIGMEPGDIQTLEDVLGIPPTTRQEVIDHHHEMIDERYISSAMKADISSRATGAPIPFSRFRKDRIVRNTSSGSTGAPTVFYEDGSRTAMNWAYELRFKSWYGIGPGAREARLARVSTVTTIQSYLVLEITQ